MLQLVHFYSINTDLMKLVWHDKLVNKSISRWWTIWDLFFTYLFILYICEFRQWESASGNGFPPTNELNRSSDLSGCVIGASWPAPLMVANDKTSPYTCVHPTTWQVKKEMNKKHERKKRSLSQIIYNLFGWHTCFSSNQTL